MRLCLATIPDGEQWTRVDRIPLDTIPPVRPATRAWRLGWAQSFNTPGRSVDWLLSKKGLKNSDGKAVPDVPVCSRALLRKAPGSGRPWGIHGAPLVIVILRPNFTKSTKRGTNETRRSSGGGLGSDRSSNREQPKTQWVYGKLTLNAVCLFCFKSKYTGFLRWDQRYGFLQYANRCVWKYDTRKIFWLSSLHLSNSHFLVYTVYPITDCGRRCALWTPGAARALAREDTRQTAVAGPPRHRKRLSL